MDDGRGSKRRRDPPPPSAEEAGPSRTRKTKRPEPPASQGGSKPSLFPDPGGTSGAKKEECVGIVAHALWLYLVSSPDAALSFVRKATPATVLRCIDWEQWVIKRMPASLLNDSEALEIFLNICIEDEAENITGNSPDSDQNVGGNYGHVAGGCDDPGPSDDAAVDITGVGTEGWTQGGAAGGTSMVAYTPAYAKHEQRIHLSHRRIHPGGGRARVRGKIEEEACMWFLSCEDCLVAIACLRRSRPRSSSALTSLCWMGTILRVICVWFC